MGFSCLDFIKREKECQNLYLLTQNYCSALLCSNHTQSLLDSHPNVEADPAKILASLQKFSVTYLGPKIMAFMYNLDLQQPNKISSTIIVFLPSLHTTMQLVKTSVHLLLHLCRTKCFLGSITKSSPRGTISSSS